MRSINPATGETLALHEPHDAAEVERRLAAAAAAFAAWRDAPLGQRTAVLERAAAALRADRDAHARLMALEMGKPVTQGEAEVDKCAWVCEHVARGAAGWLAPEPVATDAAHSHVRFDPLGVVLAVMPWNFPFWQVFRCAAPALAAGNAVLLKHASNVSGAALAIERVFAAAGLPRGLFAALLVPSGAVAGLVAHPAVAAVSLTGSEEAGVAVGAAAGAALKPAVLELGGSDPFIVLEDADPEAAAAHAAAARILNSGQSCIAAKRFIVVGATAERFERALIERMSALVVGDPLSRATQVGPLARADLREALDGQVRRSLAAGARLGCGGRALPGPGFYYAPTVLLDVRPGMAAFDEETFGPLAAVTRARDEDEAVALANRSRFGLGASVWTADPAHGARLAPRLEAGSVFVNGVVKSDPRLPFGGIKRSGFGRELAREGIRAFVNVKTVWVGGALTPPAR
uniref:Aldehyde dehydrogenase family protein n=1 Tax=Eiseniibacteriota bacterium TaxID=2212470 RepID=A0A832HZL4_UNCEI